MRARRLLHPLVLRMLGALALAPACAGDGDDVIECETAGDCNIDEACRDARCVPLDEVSEGEGEGEGEGDWVTTACGRFASCAFVDMNQCVEQLTAEHAALASNDGPSCAEAADAMATAYRCLETVSCEALNDGTWFDTCGQPFDAATVLRDACLGGSGEGEGEGEGETCFEANALPSGDVDAPALAIVIAERDPGFDAECADGVAVGLVLEVDADVTLPLSGLASFDGENVVELVALRPEDDFIVSAIACSFFGEPSFIAVSLLVEDRFTRPACAPIQRLEGEMTP